ncbi:MAG: tRNA (adenosine(37)-N6)-threonylcarbamoyltransferase complex ATPase subunit type 1 TsaE, partial [Candidatus Saccharimonadales bacterium]
MSTKKFMTRSAEETRSAAARFAAELMRRKPAKTALVLALQGDLGAGKTTFAQGFAEGLGIKEVVNSPTFVVIKRFKIYASNFKNFYHIDCYRLGEAEELSSLGLRAIIDNPENIVAIEWPERIALLLPKHRFKLKFEAVSEYERHIAITI